jgi:hypothetical protein
MAKYRKKPVVIEAMQWDGENTKEILQFMGQKVEIKNKRTYEIWQLSLVKNGWRITTLEGGHIATVGDYIIKGVHGEFYPCKPDIFEETYESVGSDGSGKYRTEPSEEFDPGYECWKRR